MKKIILFALIATFAITGCKKDEDNTPSYTGEVTISGTKTAFTDMVFLDSNTGTDHYYTIYSSGDNSIEIDLINPTIGTIAFSDYNEITIFIDSKSYDSKDDAGNFTINQIDDTTISGTFTGTFTENSQEISITGKFTAKKFSWGLEL